MRDERRQLNAFSPRTPRLSRVLKRYDRRWP
jgi:hypothetical protein